MPISDFLAPAKRTKIRKISRMPLAIENVLKVRKKTLMAVPACSAPRRMSNLMSKDVHFGEFAEERRGFALKVTHLVRIEDVLDCPRDFRVGQRVDQVIGNVG